MHMLADAGIPMLAWQLPLTMMLFVPVVATESLIAWLVLRQRLWRVTRRVSFANSVSTFLGTPLLGIEGRYLWPNFTIRTFWSIAEVVAVAMRVPWLL